MKKNMCILFILLFRTLLWSEPFAGFQNAAWGMSPEQVMKAAQITTWSNSAITTQFASPDFAVFEAMSLICGTKGLVRYYFYKQKFFQVTVTFDFTEFTTFDFNYNVFISVDKYYRHIRDKTLVFVTDIYDLLKKKYGNKRPYFKSLNPQYMFVHLDTYIKQEIWNLRYHPYEYYRSIVTSAYAQWDFVETRVIFSIALSAKDKRFDYQLSLTSMNLEREINAAITKERVNSF